MSEPSRLSSRALQPLTHRRVFAVAVPAFLSGITEPLLSLADVVIMGQLETQGLQGGVTAGSEIFVFTLWTLGFLRLSTGGYAAQAFGERNERKLFAVLWRGLLIAAVGGSGGGPRQNGEQWVRRGGVGGRGWGAIPSTPRACARARARPPSRARAPATPHSATHCCTP